MSRVAGTRLVLFAASVLVVVALAELGLRFAGIDPSPTSGWRAHADLGWVQNPGSSYDYVVADELVHVAYNSLGFRDVEHATRKPPGRRRVVIIGDSFSTAVQVDFEDTFGALLSSLLNAGAPEEGERWEVINLGVGDFGTAQERLALELYGLAYEPDVVVHQIFPLNDVCNNALALAGLCKSSRDDYRPYFVLEDGKLAQRTAAPWRNTARRSFVFRLLERGWISLAGGLEQEVTEEEHTRRIERAGLPLESPLLHTFVDDARQMPGIAAGWAATEAMIEAVHDLCRENDIAYLPVVIPFHRRTTSAWAEFSQLLPTPMVRDLPEQRLGRLFDRLGVPSVMMLETLDAYPRVAVAVRDGHLGPGSHRLVALEIYRAMVAAGTAAPPTASAVARIVELRAELDALFPPSAPGILFGARENPIRVCDGSGLGMTELYWDAGARRRVELRIEGPSGRLFTAQVGRGARSTGKWVRDGMRFYLLDPNDPAAVPDGGTTLATLDIRVTADGCPLVPTP
jgi:hypothetical protein